jgi:CRP-like cAMP-binding protein
MRQSGMAVLSDTEKAIFERHSWFAQLPGALKARLFEGALRKSLADGDRLYSRDERAESWFGLLRGAIKVGNVTLHGEQLILTYVEPGDWVGELSLIDHLPRSHDGIAQGMTEVLIVPAALFRQLLAAFPELPIALLAMQARRMRLMFAAIEDLNVLPLDARLAKQLLNLASSYGKRDTAGVEIVLRLAQADLAQLVGASRQRVNQELKGMERRGILCARYGRLVLQDEAALRSVAMGARG